MSVDAAVNVIQTRRPGFVPRAALVLGSGLGRPAEAVADATIIPYADLPGFPRPSVAGHGGRLLLGSFAGAPVAVLHGRAHAYEGHAGRGGGAGVMNLPIRVLKRLGCEMLVLTNAAGSLKPEMGPGSLMLLTDHINFSGANPLLGEGDEQGSRFVDLTDAYDPALRRTLLATAAASKVKLHQGVYVWFLGPSFETPAEIKAARTLGGDAVGMSTVPEVIVARQAGIKVAAISLITNLAAGMSSLRISHEHTQAEAAKAADEIERLLAAFVAAVFPGA
ncbi:MAG: purine-nucleoside phosphorylase [Alphaproteobacteria bacterium]|nr:purine-nucleoside phosphorylase [Alphaproteobacteria bacterium]